MLSKKEKMRVIIIFVLKLILVPPVFGQIEKYGHPKSFDDIGTVYAYRKSNWDGTHSSTIFLYVADSSRLESFKWTEGDEMASVVTAIIDWKTFSVKQFQNHRLSKDKEPELIATLKVEDEKLIRIEVGDMRDSLLLSGLPWQSYDFDFAGLGFTWRALKDKRTSFNFNIADRALVNNNMAFVNKGKCQVKFLGEEKINNKNCLKYSVDGEGLENKGGFIWIDPLTYMIEQYKITLPDEPGFENGMLRLLRTEKMNNNAWQVFLNSKFR